ncbi:MAG: Fe(3+) ABC transporter substrate-binding protein [Betaproteobacteria bacterium]
MTTGALPGAAEAQDNKTLNLYSARHYQTDEALYDNFTKATGIKINRIDGGEDALMERIRNEGPNSPADVFITVDVGRLWRAEQMGLFAPVQSKVLESRIPASYRDPAGHWFGFSTRARVIAYNKAKVKPAELTSYEDLADPRWKGRLCTRSASHVYNLSLMGSIIGANGEPKAEEWARGVAGNLARAPKGGDTDQLKAVAAGECDVAITNTYYYARIVNSDKAEDRKLAAVLGVIMPNQAGRGTHVNISGAGMLKFAPNKEAAAKFLEYLASDAAQLHFADGNNEWPVVAGLPTKNPALNALGTFKADAINIAVIGRNQPVAQKIFDRVGYK